MKKKLSISLQLFFATIGIATSARTFAIDHYSVTDLGGGLSGSYYGSAGAINNLGQVVGTSVDLAGNRSAFIWDNGIATSLGLGGAAGINNVGQVVGYGLVSNHSHATVWQNGNSTDIVTNKFSLDR